MIRVFALDVGEKRIGLAVSDALGYTAQGITTYNRTDDIDHDIDEILKIAAGYAPVKLLFGLPKNMDGTLGFQAQYVNEFADKVREKFDGEIVFYDERLTTAAARRILVDADVSRKKRKGVIDKIAACIILEGYLGSGSF